MRSLILFAILGAAIGAATIWHFTRTPENLETAALTGDAKDWDPKVLRDNQGEIVLGGGPPPAVSKGAPAKNPPQLMKNDAAPKPAESSTKKSAGGEETYKVKSGDTLGAIAKKKYGSAAPSIISAIVTKNSLKSADQLKLGMELILPDPAALK